MTNSRYDTPKTGETTGRRRIDLPEGMEIGVPSGYFTPLELVGRGGMGSLIKARLDPVEFVAPYTSAHVLSGDLSPALIGITGKYQLDDAEFEEEVRRRIQRVDRKSTLFGRMREELERRERKLVEAGYIAAVKIPSAQDAVLTSRFFREVRILHNMGDHPNIVKYISCDSVEGRLALIMEFVPWPNLAQTLKESKPSTEWAMGTFIQILGAVHHAHQKGIVHRDIKPSNILTNGQGIKITDFGLAKSLASEAERTQLTMAEQLVGTPAYMAPEQIDPTLGDLGEWTDIYQLGLTLFEMVTGRALYDEKEYKKLRGTSPREGWKDSDPRKEILADVSSVGRMHPYFPREFDPTIPDEIEKFVMTLCQKDILERYTCDLAMEHAQEIVRHKVYVHAEPLKPPSEEKTRESRTTLILSASEALLAKRAYEESNAYATGARLIRQAEAEQDLVVRADYLERAAQAVTLLSRAKFPDLHSRLEALAREFESAKDDVEAFRPNRKIALEIDRAFEALVGLVESDSFYETPTSEVRKRAEVLRMRSEQHLERIRRTGLGEKIVGRYLAALEHAVLELSRLGETHERRKETFVRRKREELDAAIQKNPNEAALLLLTLKRALEAGDPDEMSTALLQELDSRYRPVLDSGAADATNTGT